MTKIILLSKKSPPVVFIYLVIEQLPTNIKREIERAHCFPTVHYSFLPLRRDCVEVQKLVPKLVILSFYSANPPQP